MRTAVLVLFVFAAVAVAAESQPVPGVPVPFTNSRMAPPRPALSSPTPGSDPSALLQPLLQMSPEERANAELTITTNSPEATQIEVLWNRGDYDAAISELRQWAGRADLRHVYVGFNWRVPIRSAQPSGWGPNIRVGTRDSAYLAAFDQENSTGHLLATSACLAGTNTDLVVDLSTDGGLTWSETHSGFWSFPAALKDLEMTGTNGYEYVVYLLTAAPDSGTCVRFDAATGTAAKMPDSSDYKIVVKTSLPADTLDEVAITSSDDQNPGQMINVVGGTRKHVVEAGASIDQGASWTLSTAVSNFYWGGLDYCFNHYNLPRRDRYVFFSCLVNRGDTMFPGYAYFDTIWTALRIPLPSFRPFGKPTTGIAAWRDSIALAFLQQTGSGTMTRCYISGDSGRSWVFDDLTDSLNTRENVSICGRHGDGLSVVWREYGLTGNRWVFYRHAPYYGLDWSGPDTVSDHMPDSVERPRVQRVASGVYGVCYIALDTSAYGSLWFNRSDLTGIAGPTPGRILPLGLAAVARRGGARLTFTNPVAGQVQLRVYDAAGRRVLGRSERLAAGAHTLDLAVPASGCYIAVLETRAATATAKFATLK